MDRDEFWLRGEPILDAMRQDLARDLAMASSRRRRLERWRQEDGDAAVTVVWVLTVIGAWAVLFGCFVWALAQAR